jgi:hypothetical protein
MIVLLHTGDGRKVKRLFYVSVHSLMIDVAVDVLERYCVSDELCAFVYIVVLKCMFILACLSLHYLHDCTTTIALLLDAFLFCPFTFFVYPSIVRLRHTNFIFKFVS